MSSTASSVVEESAMERSSLSSGSGMRMDLLAAIQMSDTSRLRKIGTDVSGSASLPCLSSGQDTGASTPAKRQLSNASVTNDMAGALARALAERNKVLQQSDDEDSNDEDDDNEW